MTDAANPVTDTNAKVDYATTTPSADAAAQGNEPFFTPVQKEYGKAAGIGALLGIPLPVVGPFTGAALGAAYVYYKRNKKD